MLAIDRPLPEPSPTPLSDRIAAGFASRPSTEENASSYWTTSLNRPTGFVPVDLGGPTPEDVARGLLLALAAVPLGVALAFATGRAGSVTVLSTAGLAFCAAHLYRRGARSVSRRGVVAVSGVVLLGVVLEVVAVVASEASVLGGRTPGALGILTATAHRLGDPTQTGRYLGATALLLVVGLAVTAGSLVWLSADDDTGGAGDALDDPTDPFDKTDKTDDTDETGEADASHD